VNQTIENFPEEYKVQAAGRDLNLFYLLDDKRERIEKINSEWQVLNTNIKFDEKGLEAELQQHPERFSPNVILRPLFQETILPNIAFIGGGGELAYWLELSKVFEVANIPFPVLILRNSFMIMDNASTDLLTKLKLTADDAFTSEQVLTNMFVRRESGQKLSLLQEKQKIESVYSLIKTDAGKVDPSLEKHVLNLQRSAISRIEELENKMMRAERKRFEASVRQLKKLRSKFFPGGTLQERADNLLPYYARYGKDFLRSIYDHSEAFPENFTLLSAE